MGRLQDRVVIVTGANSGIGAATARLLAAEGARLVLNARRRELLEVVAKETGGLAVPGDVTDATVRGDIVRAAGTAPYILVNNAGYGEPGPVETVEEEDLRRQFEVNFFSAAALARAVLPAMRAAGEGRIINVSSVAGRFGYPLFGWYCASKHALEGLSDALRHEARPFGIHVSLIEPGPVRTSFFDVAKREGEAQMTDASSPYAPFFAHTEAIEKSFLKRAASSTKVAKVIRKAATKPRPKARYPITMLARSTLLAMRFLPSRWVDAVVRKQFRVPPDLRSRSS